MRTYKGYELVETDSGWGARPVGTRWMIGYEGTLGGRGRGYASIRELKREITDTLRWYREQELHDDYPCSR